jgi:hypothetical protein
MAYAAWLSVYGKDEQQRLAAEFVSYILQRAEKAGKGVYEKANKIIEEGKARGSLTLKGFEERVEVDGEKRKVRVIGGEAVEADRGDRKLLRIKLTAEVGRAEGEHTIVNRVVREYTITYSRRTDNAAVGFAVARADVPGGREADAERLLALIEALTGVRPKICRLKDGMIVIECYGGHLEGFRRFVELADAIEKWLEEAGR